MVLNADVLVHHGAQSKRQKNNCPEQAHARDDFFDSRIRILFFPVGCVVKSVEALPNLASTTDSRTDYRWFLWMEGFSAFRPYCWNYKYTNLLLYNISHFGSSILAHMLELIIRAPSKFVSQLGHLDRLVNVHRKRNRRDQFYGSVFP